MGLAFKLQESRFGQLTYMRVYQGTIKRRDQILDVTSGSNKKIAVPRLVRMTSDDMEEIDSAGAGEIVAMFGVECVSGATFVGGNRKLTMTSMFVPNPVISLSIVPKDRSKADKFTKVSALAFVCVLNAPGDDDTSAVGFAWAKLGRRPPSLAQQGTR